MKKDKILGIIRHALTFLGGIIVSYGMVEEAMAQELIGGIFTVVGLIWSVIDKNKTIEE
jgi:hypothetical protein